jgi:hypothetical protein
MSYIPGYINRPEPCEPGELEQCLPRCRGRLSTRCLSIGSDGDSVVSLNRNAWLQ